MPSAWIAHVKKFATEHKIKFGEALADKRCSASYKSLQTSVPNKGPMSFVPVDAVPKKKSAKRSKSKSSSSKRTQSKKTKTNSKSKVTKSRGRGKKSSTKTQSAGGNKREITFYRNGNDLYITYKGKGKSKSLRTTTQTRKIINDIDHFTGGNIGSGGSGRHSVTFKVVEADMPSSATYIESITVM